MTTAPIVAPTERKLVTPGNLTFFVLFRFSSSLFFVFIFLFRNACSHSVDLFFLLSFFFSLFLSAANSFFLRSKSVCELFPDALACVLSSRCLRCFVSWVASLLCAEFFRLSYSFRYPLQYGRPLKVSFSRTMNSCVNKPRESLISFGSDGFICDLPVPCLLMSRL